MLYGSRGAGGSPCCTAGAGRGAAQRQERGQPRARPAGVVGGDGWEVMEVMDVMDVVGGDGGGGGGGRWWTWWRWWEGMEVVELEEVVGGDGAGGGGGGCSGGGDVAKHNKIFSAAGSSLFPGILHTCSLPTHTFFTFCMFY